MEIYWEHFNLIEQVALKAVNGLPLPSDYKASLVPHGSPMVDGDLTYLRVAVMRDGVEVGDVGLALRSSGWIVAGSGYSKL